MKKVIKQLLELIQSNSSKKELVPVYVNKSNGSPLKSIKKLTLLFVFVFAGMFTTDTNAQILKKIGKKIEKQTERRAERKVDRAIDKGFDKVEDGIDKSVKEGTKKREKDSKNKNGDEPDDALADNEVNFLTDNEPYSLNEANTVKMKDGLVMVSADCDDYIWFKKGATMSFKATSGSGNKQEVTHTQMVVKSVSNENGKKVSVINATSKEMDDFDMDIRYLCSGNNLYVDMGAAIKQAMAKAGQDNPQASEVADNIEMGFGEGFMDIPKNMYPGQKLKDVNFTMKTKTSNMEMMIITNLTDRTVGQKVKITTPAGAFECMPITGVRKTAMKVMGMNRNMGKPTTETDWYAPGIGMVKTESYDAKGKIQSSQILTEFKR